MLPPSSFTKGLAALLTLGLAGTASSSSWLIGTSRAAEPLPRVWHPSDLNMTVAELTQDERWSEAIEALLAEPIDHLSREHRDEARAVLLASVTRLDRTRGIKETQAFMAKRPRASAALVTLLALQDRCDQAVPMARRIVGPDAISARLVAFGCEVRLGKRQRAITAWRNWRRTLGEDQDAIRSAHLSLSWSIPRDDGDDDRRAALLRAHGSAPTPSATPGNGPATGQAAAGVGDLDAWFDVLATDCQYEDEGPFGPRFHDELFDRDLPLAKAAFSKDPARLADLDLLVKACREDGDGWSLETLPKHTMIFDFVRSTLLQPTDEEAAQLLERLGFELERRAKAGDVAAWRALVRLELQVAENNGKRPLWQTRSGGGTDPANTNAALEWPAHLLERARFGLERFGDERAAEIVLHHDALTSASARAIITRFPNSYLVAIQRLNRATEAFLEDDINEREFEAHALGVAQTMIARFGREADFRDLLTVMELLEGPTAGK
jgi:hypothetical protein